MCGSIVWRISEVTGFGTVVAAEEKVFGCKGILQMPTSECRVLLAGQRGPILARLSQIMDSEMLFSDFAGSWEEALRLWRERRHPVLVAVGRQMAEQSAVFVLEHNPESKVIYIDSVDKPMVKLPVFCRIEEVSVEQLLAPNIRRALAFYRLEEENLRLRKALADCELPSGDVEMQLAGIPLRDVERHAIRHTLENTGGNMYRTARMLGISRSTLYSKVKRFGLEGVGRSDSAASIKTEVS
jgi:DNA-binding NtrC family response regulator